MDLTGKLRRVFTDKWTSLSQPSDSPFYTYLHYKSSSCTHPNGCVLNLLLSSLKSFAKGTLLAALGRLVHFIAMGEIKNPIKLLAKSLNKQVLLFGALSALFSLLYYCMTCTIRAKFPRLAQSKVMEYLATTVSSVSLCAFGPETRRLVSLFTLSLALECMYRKYVAIYHTEGRHSHSRVGIEAALFVGFMVIFQLVNYMDQGTPSFQRYMEKIMQIEGERLLYYSHT